MKIRKLGQGAGWIMGVVLLAVGVVHAQTSTTMLQVNIGEAITVPLQKVATLAIADPAIADIKPLSESESTLIGKKVGVTTLTVVHTEGKPTEMYRIEVGNEAVLSTVRKAIGSNVISVKLVGDTLVLEGQAENELDAQRAEQVAKAYKPQVLNLVEVKEPRQIKIKVRVAEVNLDESRKIGLKWLGDAGQVQYGFTVNSAFNNAFGDISHTFVNQTSGTGVNAADVLLQLFESKGWGRVLSEPTLITRSGTEASFLVGQEVPIVQTLANSQSVTFKEVGVRMNIKPTADSQNRINTIIHAEVSSVGSAAIQGLGAGGVPVFNTRKADTTLQVNDGQTIVIGGLFDNNITPDTLRKFPWLADIPVLGALFRHHESDHFRRELLFFMTPSVVKDTNAETDGAAQTPVMKDWNKNSKTGVLELPSKDDTWGLHNPENWGLPETEKSSAAPAPVESVTEPARNFTPARPVAP